MMSKTRRRLIAAETVAAVLAGLLAAVTVFWRDWLEILFRVDPDHHSGAAELVIVAGLASLSLLLAVAARWQAVRWTRPAPALRPR
jgi:tetrahydromethanopterin S-methyltransferase subunit E